MIICKRDLLSVLAQSGFSQYELRKQGLLGQATIAKLRVGGLPSWRELDIICQLTGCSVGDLIEYVPGPNDRIQYSR